MCIAIEQTHIALSMKINPSITFLFDFGIIGKCIFFHTLIEMQRK